MFDSLKHQLFKFLLPTLFLIFGLYLLGMVVNPTVVVLNNGVEKENPRNRGDGARLRFSFRRLRRDARTTDGFYPGRATMLRLFHLQTRHPRPGKPHLVRDFRGIGS